MPSLPFNLTYKSKAKLAKGVSSIRSPFSLKRGETATAAQPIPAPIPQPQPPQPLPSEVLDIHEPAPRYSLDFDGGKHADDDDVDMADQEEPVISRTQVTEIPRVQLDIDISPDGLADWAANFLQSEGFGGLGDVDKSSVNEVPREDQLKVSPRRMSTGTMGILQATFNDESQSEYSEEEEQDLLASLRAMEASHYNKAEDDAQEAEAQEILNKKRLPEPLVLYPKDAYGLRVRDSLLSGRSSRQMSMMDSAVSGTTLARALFANSFLLSSDSRSSRYRSGSAGLTRTDSTTLPRGDYHLIYDGFPISPDAPPIPSNAERLYEPPKKSRNTSELKEKRKKDLKRRSSTGSLATRRLPDTPNSLGSSRGNSGMLSPGAEFDLKSLLLKTPTTLESRTSPATPSSSVARSPLPPTPQGTNFLQSALASEQSSVANSFIYASESSPTTADANLLSPTSAISDPPGSGKDLDGILSSYTHPESPEPFSMGGPYRPGISPISEENSAQLSPPAPYRPRRESARMQPIGARSPMSGSTRRVSTRAETMPIIPRRAESRLLPKPSARPKGERPLSSTQTHLSPTPSQTNLSASASSRGSTGSDLSAPLEPPPPLSTVFNRQRSGSLPSPIQVVRDSKDPNAYDFEISSEDGGSTVDETPTNVTQDFPETPEPFSPLYTAKSDNSVGTMAKILEGQEVTIPLLAGPMSATLPSRPIGHASLAQQVLLTRAGTSVGHARQPSAGKLQIPTNPTGSPASKRLAEISNDDAAEESASPSEGEEEEEYDKDNVDDVAYSPLERVHSSFRPISMSTMSTSTSIYSDNHAGSHTEDYSHRNSVVTSIRGNYAGGSDAASMYTSASDESRTKKSLPAIPTLPLALGSPQTPQTPSFPSEQMQSTPSSNTIPLDVTSSATDLEPTREATPVPNMTPSRSESPISIQLPQIPPAHSIPSLPQNAPPPPRARARPPPPALTFSPETSAPERTIVVNDSDTTSASSSNPSAPSIPAPSIPAPSNVPAPQENRSNHSRDDVFTGRGSDIFRATSLGSPPPYYSVVGDLHPIMSNYAMAHSTPAVFTTASPPVPAPAPAAVAAVAQTPPAPAPALLPPAFQSSLNDTPPRNGLSREDSINGQRSRIRPQLLPAGPRRPSMQVLAMPAFANHRETSESMSYRQQRSVAALSPKFQTASPRWRGYTMEAAKWTFTSAQLQAIVSKAIRQSAEASFIRLLRLEAIETEIPLEIQRLEAQRTDLKTRYKVFTRRRVGILEGLSNYVAEEADNVGYGLRLVEELKELVIALDKLTEELHSLDNQIAHLETMLHVHDGSALAMALRQLNSSLLKRMAENQALRAHIESLEAERDEAWQQAESVAEEFDKLADSPTNNRSSHVSAKRKSSIRVSQAGLRSQRSSLGSAAATHVGLSFHSARSPLGLPPVPPLPRARLHLDISAESPIRTSAAFSSQFTPTSENVALVKAQDDLYNMLGLRYPERKSIRRSRSVGSAPPLKSPSVTFKQQSIPPPVVSTPSLQPPENVNSRRASLPGDSDLAETYSVMTADRNAILATIDMLSVTD